ncbi:MAG: hypothetical protein HY904_17065 [Deltaproteobacteria bacterium]|nr:hypothetical protein [Deltaproteobacteria bacterium]
METWCAGSGRASGRWAVALLATGMWWAAGCTPTDGEADGGPDGGGGNTSSSSGGSGSTSSGSGGSSSSSGGSSSGGLCQPVSCTLACQFGFASGPDGCLTCSCLPDPRACPQLGEADCRGDPACAAVTFQDAAGVARFQCCDRDPSGAITCAGPPPPPTCQSDAECAPGTLCNTWDFCELPPGCTDGQACPAVCYGRCVPTGGSGCGSDYDCMDMEFCAYPDTATPCSADPNSGACSERNLGTCQALVCPGAWPRCQDGSEPVMFSEPHRCPVPVCGDSPCTGLPPDQCELRRDCMAQYTGECACTRCEPGANDCPPCECPAPAYACVDRPGCFSDDQCMPGEWCDFSFDTCTMCGRPPMGLCVPRADRCQGLDEVSCVTQPGCVPVYGEACPACAPGEPCPPCSTAYAGCRPDDTRFCSQDLDCGPGMRCNLCPPDPTCPMCDVCGAPICEPAPPSRCSSDVDCGPGATCRIEVCTDSIPPFCTGSCMPAPSDCAGLDQASCAAAPNCRPLFEQGCNDGCHDAQGRLISCGPCMAIACAESRYTGCEPVPAHLCCSDFECARGESCQWVMNINMGQCLPDVTACGAGGLPGTCPSGSECHVVGCAMGCENDTGAGGCCPAYACVPVNGCTADADCGAGMFCNACPSMCTDPAGPCITMCGPARCESLPVGACRDSSDCAVGCGCRPGPTGGYGTCSGPADELCTDRPFRVCSDDTQCLPDEMCQRCPPGAACFVADHCVPRERPFRACASDAECLPDEHCGDTCPPGAVCDQAPHCVPGAPSLRVCSSNLECRPDEYCQRCPPGAACFVADHCEPRGFRVCGNDAECLPDEFCATCPAGAMCLVADHCALRDFRTCQADGDCIAGEHCEKCPPGAMCLVADHCVANAPTP